MIKRTSFAILLLVLIVGLTGCMEPEVNTIQVSGPSNNILILADGNQMVLTASVLDQRGEVFPFDPDKITWQVSDPSIASIDASTGKTVTLTALAAENITLILGYDDIEVKETIFVFAEQPQVVVFNEDFEGFNTGALSASNSLSVSGTVDVISGKRGQGDKALKLRVTEAGGSKTNADFRADFGSGLKNHKISFLINKPAGVGTANVHLLGTEVNSGFQLTNGNAVRYRTTEGSVSADTQIGEIASDQWVRIEIEFNDDAGTYSFYQGSGASRTVIGSNIKYAKGDNGITGLRVVHQGNANTDIFIDDIIVTDLVLENIGL